MEQSKESIKQLQLDDEASKSPKKNKKAPPLMNISNLPEVKVASNNNSPTEKREAGKIKSRMASQKRTLSQASQKGMFTTGDMRSGDQATSESPSKFKATTVDDF